ncbi:MAG TPA: hypothetical protein VN704_08805 [Verrucomicrobiae bacterium]|nr:hypothetical protein [Verrucomicrobiae bacterium]
MKKIILSILLIVMVGGTFICANIGLASALNQSSTSSNNTTNSNQSIHIQSASTQPGSIGQPGQSQSHSGQSQSQSGPAGSIGQTPNNSYKQ